MAKGPDRLRRSPFVAQEPQHHPLCPGTLLSHWGHSVHTGSPHSLPGLSVGAGVGGAVEPGRVPGRPVGRVAGSMATLFGLELRGAEVPGPASRDGWPRSFGLLGVDRGGFWWLALWSPSYRPQLSHQKPVFCAGGMSPHPGDSASLRGGPGGGEACALLPQEERSSGRERGLLGAAHFRVLVSWSQADWGLSLKSSVALGKPFPHQTSASPSTK